VRRNGFLKERDGSLGLIGPGLKLRQCEQGLEVSGVFAKHGLEALAGGIRLVVGVIEPCELRDRREIHRVDLERSLKLLPGGRTIALGQQDSTAHIVRHRAVRLPFLQAVHCGESLVELALANMCGDECQVRTQV
jgi:hypothetical protein